MSEFSGSERTVAGYLRAEVLERQPADVRELLLRTSILERVSEQAIATGFKNVVIMGDHGGGQPQTYADVAKKLDAKYGPQGKHVFFCDEVYAKAQGDFDKWLQ